jgi:hypothetical protein
VTLVLSHDEIVEFTGKSRPSYQARELEHLGVPYQRRRDGTLVVLRIHVQVVESKEPALRLGGR